MARLIYCLLVVLCVFPGFLFAEEAGVPAEETPETVASVEPADLTYDSGDRRDPFIPLIAVTSGPGSGKKKTPRVLGTLESYDIPDFKIIAIIKKGDKGFYASLLAPDNKSFVVKEGTVIGLNGGKISEIHQDRMIVVEYIEDYKGNNVPRQVTLELYEGGVE
jgi:type IV pilus assembly protein PilP